MPQQGNRKVKESMTIQPNEAIELQGRSKRYPYPTRFFRRGEDELHPSGYGNIFKMCEIRTLRSPCMPQTLSVQEINCTLEALML